MNADPEVLLLRSHRVSESSWDEAFATAASAGEAIGAELVRREMVPAGELEILPAPAQLRPPEPP